MKKRGAGDIAWLVECLPGMQESVGLVPSTTQNQTRWLMPIMPALWKTKEEEQKFKVITGHTVSLRPTWVIQNPVPPPKKRKETTDTQEIQAVIRLYFKTLYYTK